MNRASKRKAASSRAIAASSDSPPADTSRELHDENDNDNIDDDDEYQVANRETRDNNDNDNDNDDFQIFQRAITQIRHTNEVKKRKSRSDILASFELALQRLTQTDTSPDADSDQTSLDKIRVWQEERENRVRTLLEHRKRLAREICDLVNSYCDAIYSFAQRPES